MADGIIDLTPDRGDQESEQPPQPATPPTPQPIPYEIHKKEGSRWPLTVVYMLMALIVAAAVVFAGRWTYRKATHKTTPKPAATQNAGSTSAKKESESKSTEQGQGVPAPTPTPTPPPTGQLPTTGG